MKAQEHTYRCNGCNREFIMHFQKIEFAKKIMYKCSCGDYYKYISTNVLDEVKG